MTRPCDHCGDPAPTCEHNATFCEVHADGCGPCWSRTEAEAYDALIGDRWETQADDAAIDARREGL